MKIIELLVKMSNGEYIPEYISYFNLVEQKLDTMLCSKSNIIHKLDIGALMLNSEITFEEDKDIPLIPDDELHIIADRDFVPLDNAIDFNFKVLKEKINQIAEEFNEYRKGEK